MTPADSHVPRSNPPTDSPSRRKGSCGFPESDASRASGVVGVGPSAPVTILFDLSSTPLLSHLAEDEHLRHTIGTLSRLCFGIVLLLFARGVVDPHRDRLAFERCHREWIDALVLEPHVSVGPLDSVEAFAPVRVNALGRATRELGCVLACEEGRPLGEGGGVSDRQPRNLSEHGDRCVGH